MEIFLSFVVGLVVTMVMIPPLIRFSARLRLVDVPDDRKVHVGEIPRIGGIAIVAGSILAVVALGDFDRAYVAFIVAALVLFIFGVQDDRGGLDYRLKFFGQLLAAGIVVVGGGIIIQVFPFFGLDPLPWYITMPFTVFVLVGVTNAINLVDGLDGLAAGTIILSMSVIGLLAWLADGEFITLAASAICGALFGFLRYNAYPARIFMGDTGSQFLGFSVCVLAIELTQTVNPALNPALPVLLLGLPLLDTVLVMVKRVRQGRSIFSPDRNHVHHQLLSGGFDHNEAVAIIYVVQGVFVVSAVVFRYYSDVFVALFYLGISTVIATSIYYSSIRVRKPSGMNQSWLSSLLEKTRNAHLIYTVSSIAVRCGLALFLVLGSVAVGNVERDISMMAGFLVLLMGIRLIAAGMLRFIPIRLLMYMSAALVMYLVGTSEQDSLILSNAVQVPFFVVMTGLLLLAISNDKSFTISTTDLLVVIIVLLLIFLPGVVSINVVIQEILLKLIVLFYACELVISSMKNPVNIFVLSSLVAFVIIFVKGV